MRIIEIEKIFVREDRQRRIFDEDRISELAESIESSKGLLHPIVVREVEDGKFQLVAGERRFRAIKTIQLLGNSFHCGKEEILPGFIPVTELSELSPLELEEAELEENVLRVDLSIQEQAVAVSRLHALRQKQSNDPRTITSTAREIYGDATNANSITKVSEQLLIAKHLDIPEVAKAKTRKEAIKVIEKIAQATHRSELAKTFDTSKTPHKLIHGSAFDVVYDLPEKYFDLILTDPPYGVDADQFGGQAQTGHNYRDDIAYAKQCYELVAEQGFRLTKDHASVYAFCDIRFFEIWLEIFEQSGWVVWPRPLIWSKQNGMLPKPDFGPRNTYEAILFAYKPGTELVMRGMPDVLNYRSVQNAEHGAQKPVELYMDLITRSANPSAKILDLFAGSGTIFVAANSTNTYATGVEFVEVNYHLALSRITQSAKDILDELEI